MRGDSKALVIALATMAVLAALVPAARAGAGGTGTIQGTVTDELTGDPVAEICIRAWPFAPEGDGPVVVTTAESGNDGRYSVDVEPGEYAVEFQDCQHPDRYVGEHYDDASWEDRRSVPVAAGATVTADAALTPTGSITGTVTAAADGSPLAGVCAAAFPADAGGDNVVYLVSGANRTAADGRYTLPGLAPGEYVVAAGDCRWDDDAEPLAYAAEYFPDASGRADATAVTVEPASETGGADVGLEIGGTITGTVTAADGDPLAGICVSAHKRGEPWLFGRAVSTGADGSYEVPGLAESSAVVRFDDCAPSRTFVGEWYDDVADYASADPVPVTLGSTTAGIDAALARGATVAGRVADEHGEPVASICVTAQDPVEGWWRAWTETAADGTYQLTGLATGDYKIGFSDCGGWRFEDRWWREAPTFDEADILSLTAGDDVTGVDVVLLPLPLPDLAVTEVGVTVPSPSHPHDPDRRVEVTIANLGDAPSVGWAVVDVEMCPATVGGCHSASEPAPVLQPGETVTVSLPWRFAGGAGTYRVEGSVIAGGWLDADVSNDRRATTHDILVAPVPGLGAGI